MLLASAGFRIGPKDLLAQCLARPKGTAQIWFGPLPPCALDTWQFVTCWCFSELGELGFCDKLMIRWPHIQFHTGNVLGSWWLIVAVAHSCILWLALSCTCILCVFCLWIYGYSQCLLNDVDTCRKYCFTTQDMGICLMQWHCKFRVGSFPTSTHNTCPTCRLMRRSSADTSTKTMIHIEKDSSVSVCLSHPGEPHLVWLIEKDYFLMV